MWINFDLQTTSFKYCVSGWKAEVFNLAHFVCSMKQQATLFCLRAGTRVQCLNWKTEEYRRAEWLCWYHRLVTPRSRNAAFLRCMSWSVLCGCCFIADGSVASAARILFGSAWAPWALTFIMYVNVQSLYIWLCKQFLFFDGPVPYLLVS